MFNRNREAKYARKAAAMSDYEVGEAYSDLKGKLTLLSQLVKELEAILTGRSRDTRHLPSYHINPDRLRDFLTDDRKARHLEHKARIWVKVLEQAIVARDITLTDILEAEPPQRVGRTLNFEQLSNFPH